MAASLAVSSDRGVLPWTGHYIRVTLPCQDLFPSISVRIFTLFLIQYCNCGTREWNHHEGDGVPTTTKGGNQVKRVIQEKRTPRFVLRVAILFMASVMLPPQAMGGQEQAVTFQQTG